MYLEGNRRWVLLRTKRNILEPFFKKNKFTWFSRAFAKIKVYQDRRTHAYKWIGVTLVALLLTLITLGKVTKVGGH